MTALADKSDQELAADVRMVVEEFNRISGELTSRGITVKPGAYTSGRIEVRIYRQHREEL